MRTAVAGHRGKRCRSGSRRSTLLLATSRSGGLGNSADLVRTWWCSAWSTRRCLESREMLGSRETLAAVEEQLDGELESRRGTSFEKSARPLKKAR
ncbi:hypothetical protein M6B38_336895 [Iris pallida]|uniref:Uncharacterized protein n=1 Tax=Iris pallida TaxID=29817 RepID=A0AAX6H049_IRIPA|nr:hypothetical protein M6B38_336895 [Iris pallida]